jgi:hypothetical protein
MSCVASAYTCCHPVNCNQNLPGTTVPLSSCNQNMSDNSLHVLMDVHICVVLDVILSKVSFSWTRKRRCQHYTIKHSIHAHVWGNHGCCTSPFPNLQHTLQTFEVNNEVCCMVMCIECNCDIYTWHVGSTTGGLGSTFQVHHFHSHTKTLLRICT